MSDARLVMAAFPRVLFVCRPREVTLPEGGGSVSEHQGRILTHLDMDDPVMVTELAEFVGVTPSTMSLTLTRLQNAGFVSRERDPDDRRVVNVRLTADGARLRDRVSVLDPERVDALLRAMRADDRRRAVEGLALLAEAADALAARTDDYVASLTGRGA
jgi:DNA-binding MarR family transcriptional regulator